MSRWAAVLMAAIVALSCAGTAAAHGKPHCFGQRATIVGGEHEDLLKGTRGDDVIVGRASRPIIHGLSGDDRICTRAGIAQLLSGGMGSDRIKSGRGDGFINDGPGDDEVVGGKGAEIIYAGHGEDVLDGGPGTDLVSYQDADAGVEANLTLGGAAIGGQPNLLIDIEALEGSPFADTLVGSDARNTISGGGGSDVLGGDDGRDWLLGGDGRDWADGGEGTDRCKAEQRTSCERRVPAPRPMSRQSRR
jgi:Ca2+-binding RTX toxin-like protein